MGRNFQTVRYYVTSSLYTAANLQRRFGEMTSSISLAFNYNNKKDCLWKK